MTGPTAEQVLERVEAFRSYRYSRTRAVYPWPLPGVGVELEAKGTARVTNCCTFLEAVLVDAFAQTRPGFTWSLELHRAFMCIGDRFGPVHAAIESGMADPVGEGWQGRSWLLVQGWQGQRAGHTFCVPQTSAEGHVLILEANNGFGLRGVGYRDVGRLRDLAAGQLPVASPEWTWDRLRARYPQMRACALRVTQ